MRKLEPYIPLLLFSLALMVRVIYVLEMRANPLFDTLIMDELYHDEWARELAGGDWLGRQIFFRAPLYPYVLGVVYTFFGPNYLLVRMLQSFLGSLSCILIFLLGRRLFNSAVGTGAGLMAALYPMLIYYDGELLITSLIVFLDLLLLLSLTRAQETPRAAWFLLSGVILGLSAIARPNILIFLPFVLLWVVFFAHSRLRLARSAILSVCLLGGCCAMIAPVTLRNYFVGEDFVLISSQAGVNFYIGNNPDSDGVTAIVPDTRGTWWGGYEDAMRIATHSEGRPLKPSEVSDFWMKKGVRFLKREPGAFLGLLARKMWLFFNGREFSNNKDIYFFSRYSRLLSILLFKRFLYFPFGVVSALSVIGLVLGLRSRRRIFLVYAFVLSYMLSVVVFFVTSRYRMPVVPVMLLFASYTAWQTVENCRRRRLKTVLLSVGGFVVVGFLVNCDLTGPVTPPDSQNYYTLGSVHSRKGELEKAKESYRKAIEADSTFADPHNNLGNIYAGSGDLTAARLEFQRALELDPSFSKAYFNLGNTYYSEGDFGTAARLYEQAVYYDSLYAEAAHFAGLAYGKLEREEDARRMQAYTEKVLRRNRRFGRSTGQQD
jgi:4-amino-4-deoxy-L-arabinose transferase-like glycosyltransferase